MDIEVNKKCLGCGVKIVGRPNKIWCSAKCRHKAHNPPVLNLPTSVIGTISETLVVADLLQRGYEVFKNVCPTGRVDIVALLDNKYASIQVKTGHYKKNGGISYAKENKTPEYYAIVIIENCKIIYIPNLPSTIIRNK